LYTVAAFIFFYELLQYRRDDQLFVCKKGFNLQLAFYFVLYMLFLTLGATTNAEFLYFQF
jgi:hypothetical protein